MNRSGFAGAVHQCRCLLDQLGGQPDRRKGKGKGKGLAVSLRWPDGLPAQLGKLGFSFGVQMLGLALALASSAVPRAVRCC